MEDAHGRHEEFVTAVALDPLSENQITTRSVENVTDSFNSNIKVELESSSPSSTAPPSSISGDILAKDLTEVYQEHLDILTNSLSIASSRTFNPPPSKLHSSATVRRDDLCMRCRGIGLDEVFGKEGLPERDDENHEGKGWQGVFIMDLEASAKDLEISHCLMCKLFGSMACEDFDLRHSRTSNTKSTCYVTAHPGEIGLETFGTEYLARFSGKSTLLSVVETCGPLRILEVDEQEALASHIRHETGFLSLISPDRAQQEIAANPICLESYDIEFAKRCLARCLHNHYDLCNSRNIEAVPFFRLIDCQSQKVVTAPPDAHYATLSYVWGAPASTSLVAPTETNHWSDLHDCPKVISDSLQVMLDLDLKYLWVDKYCINQFDNQDKEVQISQMDLIYANAEVTIIAAAGEGPQHGLPGVRGTLRKGQPALKIEDRHIASTLPHCRNSILRSKWATRGWTYQEGILSKRRLFFTDQQVFWECNGMHCGEAITALLDPPHAFKDTIFDHRSEAEDVFIIKTPGSDPWHFWHYVAEFRQRELTYHSDSINALSGIFRTFEKGRIPLYHLIGVPIFPAHPSDEPALLDETLNQSTLTSTVATRGFLIGLTWLFSHPPRARRPIFPSWSWAGWTGAISAASSLPALSWNPTSLDYTHVWIEIEENTLLSFPAAESLKTFLSHLPRDLKFLHIEASTFSCTLTSYSHDPMKERVPEEVDDDEFEVEEPQELAELELQIHENMRAFLSVQLDRKPDFISSKPGEKFLTGILVGDTSGHSLEVVVLIVEENELEGFYERIACCRLASALRVDDDDGLTKNLMDVDGGMEIFLQWIRDGTVRRTVRLG